MIDLSFLTEEEQETILGVLHRDSQLKKAEERRVKSLQRSVKDRGLLKYLSGEWFYETKSLRHQDRIHGCDIIRASIRPKHRPHTLLELSQMLPERPSFVASGNQEVYIPPELCGLIQEDPKNRSNLCSYIILTLVSKQQRKNPFNCEALAPNKPPEVTGDTAKCLSSAEFSLSHATKPNPEPLESIAEEATNTSTPFPMYRRTSLFHSSQDGASQAHYPTPRGILKVMSDQGSTDSLVSTCAVPQSSPDRGSAAEDAAPTGRDALGKQVRFGPAVGHANSVPLDNQINPAWVYEEVKSPVPKEVRSLQHTALQNTAFKDSDVSLLDTGSDPQQEPTESKEDVAQKLSNLKAFWERENNESLAGSVKDFQENSASGPELCSPLLPEDQSSHQEDKPTTITDLKCFWEKEYSGPKIIVAKVKETSSGADHSSPDKSEDLISKVYPSQPDLNEEAENANIISNTKPMIGKGFVTKSLGKSQLSKLSHESEFSPPPERPLSPIMSQSSRSRDSSDDELRRSPSKTCHPKVLVRESSLPRGSAVEGSPLKTFPIDIALEPKDDKEEGERPTPSPRQRTDPSHEAKATGSTSIPSEGFISLSLPLPPEDSEKETLSGSSKMFGSSTPLVRSFIPDDYHHYLGSPEKAHLPPFEEEKSTVDSDMNLSSSVSMDGDGPFGTKPRRRTASVVSNLSLASMSSVSGSVTSISHGNLGDIEVQGTMQFALNYVQKLGELQIFVVQCRDLALAEPKKSRSDPYVKCYLVPDKTKLGKRKTTVKKRTLNPSYNEILRFKILMEVLKMQKLNISVWHNDTFGRNSFLGEISLDFFEWDFGNTQINDYTLKPRFSSPLAVCSKPTNKRGQMRVALRYLPQPSHSKNTSKMEPGEVQIWVKDCKDLPPARGVIIDPFVKCTVLPDTSKKSRQKTRVVKRTANPMFNHTMVYDGFRPEDLREACAEITVWDHDRLNNHYIGGLRLGLGTGKSYGAEVDWMDSSEPETNLWEKMMGSDGEWVEDILPLRTFVVAKSMAK
ncbi:unnamed protein product [Lota lota]